MKAEPSTPLAESRMTDQDLLLSYVQTNGGDSLDALRAAQDAEVRRLGTLDPWDWASISWNPDFRRTVALRYVAWLVKEMASGSD